jgi:dihydroorotate dehydrogenase (NAD+) catalytic subunit
MFNLEIEIAGVKFKYPVVVSAGPLSKDEKSILSIASQKGVGGVVTKTIYSEPTKAPMPSMIKVECGLINIDWSDIGKEKWIQEFEIAKKCDLSIIASVKGKSPEETLELARLFQDAGASMIEIPLSPAPLSSLTKLIEHVKKGIEIPFVAKFGPNLSDIPLSFQKFQEAWADVFSCINTIGPALAIDIETAKPLLGGKYGFGYLSGPAIKPIALRCVAQAYVATSAPIFGGGGISSGKDAIEMLLAGASVICLQTAAIWDKGVFRKIIVDLLNFMRKKGFTDVSELVGPAYKRSKRCG